MSPIDPTLSVIVRTVKRLTRLDECLSSLAAQRECALQIVVVDMSGGGAHDIVSRHLRPQDAHLDTRGRVLNRPAALNYGIERAAAPFIAILDDDNCWAPHQAATLVRLLKMNRADLAYTGVTRRDCTPQGVLMAERRLFTPFDYDRLVLGNYIYTSATGFSREAWNRVGRFDPRFPVYEDWEFLIRLARNARVAFEESHGAISRSFTGQPGVSAHFKETESCERCVVGLRWKHRRYTAEVVRRNPALIARDYAHIKDGRVSWKDWQRLLAWSLSGRVVKK